MFCSNKLQGTITGTSFLPWASVTAFLAGVVAIFAGIAAFRKSVGSGAYATPSVPYDSVSCSYCNKSGISPQATSCPGCGQPLPKSVSCPHCGKARISPQAASCPNCGQPVNQ